MQVSNRVVKTCSDCPLAYHLGGQRYRCEAEHRIGIEVVRGHWKTTVDCVTAIKDALCPTK